MAVWLTHTFQYTTPAVVGDVTMDELAGTLTAQQREQAAAQLVVPDLDLVVIAARHKQRLALVEVHAADGALRTARWGARSGAGALATARRRWRAGNRNACSSTTQD